MRIEVKPALLRWAAARAEIPLERLEQRFSWLAPDTEESLNPTLKQLESFANATYTPIGYFFLPHPPDETIPIPDFRTMGNERLDRPSANLLDTIYACQQRQEWYREFARAERESPLPFIGAARPTSDVVTTAAEMRRALGLDISDRRRMPTWTDALRRLNEQADDLGVLVMVSGIVGNNTHRKLDPAEFRGFALADPVAPLVFINGADTKAAQMFTLAHELAHLWLGESAVSDSTPVSAPTNEIERWCNRVAAELLVPLEEVRHEYRPSADIHEEMDRLARQFKVSTLVVLRRIHDVGGISTRIMWETYHAEVDRLREFAKSSGGNFYPTLAARTSKRLGRAMVVSTLEGRTSFTEALRLLGIRNLDAFNEFGRYVEGVAAGGSELST